MNSNMNLNSSALPISNSFPFPLSPHLPKQSPPWKTNYATSTEKTPAENGPTNPLSSTNGRSRLRPGRKGRLREFVCSRRLSEAMALYTEMRGAGVEPGVVLESMLIDSFMKSGRLSDAFRVFEAMPERNVVAWTSMISGCVKNGCQETGLSLFGEMLVTGQLPNDFTFSAALQACSDLADVRLGQHVHSLIIRSGLERDCRVGNCLIEFYSRCRLMEESKQVFDRMQELDLVSFTSLISGLCRSGLFQSAVRMFSDMLTSGLDPNEHTITSILAACGPQLGKQVHGYMIKNTIAQGVYSGTALMEFYSRNFEFDLAKRVFYSLETKNVVNWSSMIACCSRNDQVDDALRVFLEMLHSGVKPNEFTFSTVIGACGQSDDSGKLGCQLHCLAIKSNFILDNQVTNALLTMYARSGKIEDLERVFETTKKLDVVSWTAVISGYFQNGLDYRSINVLSQMHRRGFTPNEYGISSALSSCANLALLDHGRQLHSLGLKLGSDLDVCMGNALINMYAKCGCIEDADLVFQTMPMHDVMSWNSLIHGYANHGKVRETLEIFHEMESRFIVPDDSTFLGILVGCSHVGCIDEAVKFFEMMTYQYAIMPLVLHYGCMIDMMGRAGRLEEALHIINHMPGEADILVWKTLLGYCKLYNNLELGKLAAQKVLALTTEDSASYVLLSNLHLMHGEWQNAKEVRRKMEDEEVQKGAGWSWIEIKNKVHIFMARDKTHPQSEFIYKVLVDLVKTMKEKEYSLDKIYILDEV